VYMFHYVTPYDPGLLGWPYLVLLGPLWIAVRLGVAAVTPLTAVVTWFATASTADALGAFALASYFPIDRLIAVQLFCAVLAITLLLLAILRDSRLRSMAALGESSLLLSEVVNGSQALVFAKSYDGEPAVEGRYVLVNDAWVDQTGLSAEGTVGSTDADLFPAETAAAFLERDLEVMESAEPIMVEEIAPNASGEVRVYSSSKFPLRREDGTVWGVGGIATDTTDLVRLLELERKQGDLLRAVFELSPTPAMRLAVHEDGIIDVLAANSAMCVLMGAEVGQMESCVLMEHVHPDDVAAARGLLAEARRGRGKRASGSIRQREVRMVALDGRTVWTLMSAAMVGVPSQGGETELVVQFEDFTARRRAEEALSNQALRDSITGLPNRRALQDRLTSALARLHRQSGVLAVLFCDLDRFKDVNDTQGHQAGDLLLIEVARRMQAALRPEDTVARLGGDEFVALGEGIVDVASAVQMAMRLLEKVSVPWIEGDQTYRPSISIGVAIVEDPDITADEVLRRADLAMYRAKDNGRGRIEIYEKSVDDRYRHAVALQHDLRRAIDSESLVLHYQPIVSLMNRDVVGAEALVRMSGRDGQLLEPSTFVPAAETSGLVIPMGAWVLRQAIAQLKAWSLQGQTLTVSVNVSPSQLRDEGFADYLLAQVEAAAVDPRLLAVEVTETSLLKEPARSARELNALSREGVGIYLDDFGTGYSSLSWLTHFPVNVVKIDRSFTDEIGVDERKTAIVSALIQVSHELGFSVVAEGVETDGQAQILVGMGCDRGQGYLFGRPTDISSSQWS
jgi:diguanylate cyclase (GGDEF)-like protein/PAS domain S-box-containing protein